MTEKRPDDRRALRRQAEKKARQAVGGAPADLAALPPAETQRLLHELLVHQIELEMQNEELHRLQSELEVSRARYFDLYELAPVGYFTLDGKGLILEANLTLAALLGVDRGGLAGQPFSRFILPEDQDAYYRHRKALLETGAPQTCEVRALRAGASPLWARLRACVGRAADGSPVSRVVMGDISEAKRLQAEREGLLAREREARAEAEAANQAKDDFLAIVSHELRTPLTAVLGWSWLLRSGDLPETERNEALDIIVRNMEAQTRIVGDLLDVSGFIRGQLKILPQPLELGSLLGSVCDALRPDARGRSIRLVCDIAPATGLMGDPGRLRQVLLNLLHNALKFTPEGGEIRVSLSRKDGRAVIEIRDTGQGIEAGFLGHVFKPFRQGEDARTRTHRGLGLGLAIVKHIIELHGGTVGARSAGKDRGAVFTIDLPAIPWPAPGAAAPAAEPALIDLAGLRILVVEDEADTRLLFKELLTRCGGRVETAASAEAAMASLERSVPDVLLCDIAMPGEDGCTFLRRLRRRGGELGALPAIAVTALVCAEDRRRALQAGFQRFLAKPAEPTELLAALSALGGRPA